MKVSVFTPLSETGNQYIRAAWDTLCQQSEPNWEWVVVENHGGSLPGDIASDPRVRMFRSDLEGVGALKRLACDLCTGDILLELDHDDLLHCQALERVVHAVSNGADFVYSDFAEFKDGTWEPNPYHARFGWKGYPVTFQGHELVAMQAPEDPVAWRRIEWAPNHLRAWRREFYEKVGGHDPSLFFADDHDLVLRSYLAGGSCVRLAQCLYFYRVHEKQNTNGAIGNARIQQCEAGVYDRHIYDLAEKIARKRLGCLIDLCGGIDTAPGFEAWDLSTGFDLNDPWMAADSTVGALRAFDALEHLTDKVHTMNEAWRVLAPGGFLLVMVPTTDSIVVNHGDGRSELVNGSGAYCDPTHVSFWNALSFRYYADAKYQRYVPSVRARFQIARCQTVNRGGIPYVQAELIALKPGYEPMGEVLI